MKNNEITNLENKINDVKCLITNYRNELNQYENTLLSLENQFTQMKKINKNSPQDFKATK